MPEQIRRFSPVFTGLTLFITLCLMTGGCVSVELPNQPGAKSHTAAAYVAEQKVAKPIGLAESYFVSADVPNNANASLLTVITYGYGCSATGNGNGLRTVAEAIRRRYPNQRVITRGCFDDDGIVQIVQNHPGPVALVGHSFGGSRSVEIASKVTRRVDSVTLLDPVPVGVMSYQPESHFRIPANVAQAVCYYRPNSFLPWSYPILNPRSASDNRLRDMGHSDFCSDMEVWRHIMSIYDQQERGTQMAMRQPAPAQLLPPSKASLQPFAQQPPVEQPRVQYQPAALRKLPSLGVAQ